MHLRACPRRPDEGSQNFKGTCAAKKVRELKLAEAQKHKQTIQCDGDELKMVFKFNYLGTIFAADGDQTNTTSGAESH